MDLQHQQRSASPGDAGIATPRTRQALKQLYAAHFQCHYCGEIQCFRSAPFGCRQCGHPPCNLCQIFAENLAQLACGLTIDVANSSQYYQPDPAMIAICCSCGLPTAPDTALSQPVKVGERMIYLSRTIGFQRANCFNCGHLCCNSRCLRLIDEKRVGFLPPVAGAGFPSARDYEALLTPKKSSWRKLKLDHVKSILVRFAGLSFATTKGKLGSSNRKISGPVHLECSNTECTICRYKYGAATVANVLRFSSPEQLHRNVNHVTGLSNFQDYPTQEEAVDQHIQSSPTPRFRSSTLYTVPRRRVSAPVGLGRPARPSRDIGDWMTGVTYEDESVVKAKVAVAEFGEGLDCDSAYFSKC